MKLIMYKDGTISLERNTNNNIRDEVKFEFDIPDTATVDEVAIFLGGGFMGENWKQEYP